MTLSAIFTKTTFWSMIIQEIEGSYKDIHRTLQVTNQNVQDTDCVKLIQTVFREVHVQVIFAKTCMAWNSDNKSSILLIRILLGLFWGCGNMKYLSYFPTGNRFISCHCHCQRNPVLKLSHLLKSQDVCYLLSSLLLSIQDLNNDLDSENSKLSVDIALVKGVNNKKLLHYHVVSDVSNVCMHQDSVCS